MADFPKGGDIAATRAWVDRKGLERIFVGSKADSNLGLEKRYVLAHGGEKALIL